MLSCLWDPEQFDLRWVSARLRRWHFDSLSYPGDLSYVYDGVHVFPTSGEVSCVRVQIYPATGDNAEEKYVCLTLEFNVAKGVRQIMGYYVSVRK